MVIRFTVVVFGVLLHTSVLLGSSVTDSVEVESLFRTIETTYAPLQYKAGQVGLNWEQTKITYRGLFEKVVTTNEFYFTAARLFGELQDAHVHTELPSSYEARLPLQFSYVEGKTVLNFIGGSLVKAKTCSAEIGDELLSIDGVGVDTVRMEISKVRGLGNLRSNQGYLTRALTSRSEKTGMRLPAGPKPKATLDFVRLNGQATRCEIAWETKGYPLVDMTPDSDRDSSSAEYDSAEQPIYAYLSTLVKLQDQLIRLQAPLALTGPLDGLLGSKEDKDAKGKKIDIGHKTPFYPLPKTFHLFKAPSLMQALITSSGLYAGTFLHHGKTVGYVRIPDYVAGHPISAQFALRFVIRQLEDEAQWLIIDQTNNPGGYVQFSDAIVESLTGKLDASKHIKFAVKPTQDFIRTYAEILALLEDSEDDQVLQIPEAFRAKYIPLLQGEMNKVVVAYEKKQNLSEPIDFHLMSELVTELVDGMVVKILSEQHPAFSAVLTFAARSILGIDPGKKYVFTKPVYMMINELDFSAGDATPAVLQDYNRVTLVGVNTAGAGGSVGQFSHHVMNPFKFTLTQSLMIRKGNAKVENVGVKPDIAMELTREDIQTNYQSYFARVLQAIDGH